jgi:hypothetical protein
MLIKEMLYHIVTCQDVFKKNYGIGAAGRKRAFLAPVRGLIKEKVEGFMRKHLKKR